jgi:hypothetical protein
MMEEARYFMIGSKKFIFDDQDSIFYADCPMSEVEGFNACYCCDMKFKNTKSVQYW